MEKNMPLKSQAQRRWAHSPAGLEALGGEKKVEEWESDTPAKLPERVKKKKEPKTKLNLRDADFRSRQKRK